MSCPPFISAFSFPLSKGKVRLLALICAVCLGAFGFAQSANKKVKKPAETSKPATATESSSAKAETGNQPAAASEEEEEPR